MVVPHMFCWCLFFDRRAMRWKMLRADFLRQILMVESRIIKIPTVNVCIISLTDH